MFDLPSMAELGAEVRQGIEAAKLPPKGSGSTRFADAVDAAGQVTGACNTATVRARYSLLLLLRSRS